MELGVVRGAATLQALVYVVAEPDPMAPWLREQRCELRPLPASSPLHVAWAALAAVTTWDATALAHVLAILRASVPSTDAVELPALGATVRAPDAPKATAAHPRAYRGTKHRPPKPALPDPVDVRPYLLARRHIAQVLERLGGTDPSIAGFDPVFVTYLVPVLRACTASELGVFAGLARSLELATRPVLRAALVGVYLAAGDAGRALGWWKLVVAADDRLEAAQLIGASGIAAIDPVADFMELDPVRRWSCYRALVAGATPEYLRGGLALGAIVEDRVQVLAPGRTDMTAVTEATTARLATAMTEDSGARFWRTHLWTLCGHQPELIDVLASPAFQSLQPRAAFWLMRIATSPRWTAETAVQEWAVLAPLVFRIAELAATLAPEYQRKLVEDLGAVYWRSIDKAQDPAAVIAACIPTCMRVARPPFATTAVLGAMLPDLCISVTLDAPEASWLALEEACRRTNDAQLLRLGMGRLVSFTPAFLVATFATVPGAVIQTADALATVSFESAQRVLKAYRASPLAAPLEDVSLARLCELVEPIARAGGPNPIRRALREHLAGTAVLSEAQLRGHRERILAALDVVRLAAIRQAVERELAARVGLDSIDTPVTRHAVAMLTNVDVHRRQLRRMLTAVLAGDVDWKLRHPRSQQWLAAHPRLDRERWLAGIERKFDDVSIGIEHDVLEALKLGTYVGSCLGRGGRLEYSAAAVVLDVNKHVVYARDARGAVIGRQLLAISEADELVCFHIYGEQRARVEPMFRAYDHALADVLERPLYRGGDYEIATILSHEWWDDSAWTLM
ncbi:MAG: hypothetical protein ABI867_15035 [Kofleriaceae bacterium]